jgi:hypothetical protein
MAKTKTNQNMEAATELLEKGIGTQDAFKAALPLIRELAAASRNVGDYKTKIETLATSLKESAAQYAIDHPKALDGGLADYKTGQKRGSVTLDGTTYSLTVSAGAVKRVSGSITAEFVESLPNEWTKLKREINEKAVKSISPEELIQHGLIREEKHTWNIRDVA